MQILKSSSRVITAFSSAEICRNLRACSILLLECYLNGHKNKYCKFQTGFIVLCVSAMPGQVIQVHVQPEPLLHTFPASEMTRHRKTCVVKRWLSPIILFGVLTARRHENSGAFALTSRHQLTFDRFTQVVPMRAQDSVSEVTDFVEDEDLMAMLMSGQGDEVDILGNGSLVKTIIQPAPAFSRRPQLGDEVTVHFVAWTHRKTCFTFYFFFLKIRSSSFSVSPWSII